MISQTVSAVDVVTVWTTGPRSQFVNGFGGSDVEYVLNDVRDEIGGSVTAERKHYARDLLDVLVHERHDVVERGAFDAHDAHEKRHADQKLLIFTDFDNCYIF
jgi:hypothetical protein